MILLAYRVISLVLRMKFTDNDLLKMDAEYVVTLTLAQSHQLNLDLLDQTKELMDRLNQNSSNTLSPRAKIHHGLLKATQK